MTDAPPPSTTGFAEAHDRVASGFARLTDFSADRVFRDPVHAGDRVVITAAAIDVAGGMGFGTGADNQGSGGGGGGLGGKSEGRPVAAIEIGPDGVTVRPIVDVTKIGMTLLLGALAVWRATRKHR